MKRILLLTFIFLVQTLQAAPTEALESPALEESAQEFSQLINLAQLEYNSSYLVSKTPVADSCMSFMNQSHFLGPWGTDISKSFVQHNTSLRYLVHGGSLNKYCRNYSKMNLQQKSFIWVLLLTVVAHFESSCKTTAHAKGTYGEASGLYQLHQGHEAEYDGALHFCQKNSSQNATQASICMLGMLEYQYEKTGGDLFSPKSYWEVLRPRGQSKKAKDIEKALLNFKLCNPSIT